MPVQQYKCPCIPHKRDSIYFDYVTYTEYTDDKCISRFHIYYYSMLLQPDEILYTANIQVLSYFPALLFFFPSSPIVICHCE